MHQLGISSQAEIKVNAYGLTGSGIYFMNSCLKLQIRVSVAPQRFEQIVKYIEEQKTDEKMLTSNSTSFVVKHIRKPQYIYV